MDDQKSTTRIVLPQVPVMTSFSIFKLLFDDEYADVFFTCTEGDVTVRIPAHKNILCKCSEVYANMFAYGKNENDSKEGTKNKDSDVPVPAEVSMNSFKIFISYMYTGNLRFATYGTSDVAEAASEAEFDISLTDLFGVLYIAKMHFMDQLIGVVLSRIVDKFALSYSVVDVFLKKGRLFLDINDSLITLKNRCLWCLHRGFEWMVLTYFSKDSSELGKLSQMTYEEVNFITSRAQLCVTEQEVFNFMCSWADHQVTEADYSIQSEEKETQKKRMRASKIGKLIRNIRISLLDSKEFACGLALNKIFSSEIIAAIFMAYHQQPYDTENFKKFTATFQNTARCHHTAGDPDEAWFTAWKAKHTAVKAACVCRQPYF